MVNELACLEHTFHVGNVAGVPVVIGLIVGDREQIGYARACEHVFHVDAVRVAQHPGAQRGDILERAVAIEHIGEVGHLIDVPIAHATDGGEARVRGQEVGERSSQRGVQTTTIEGDQA